MPRAGSCRAATSHQRRNLAVTSRSHTSRRRPQRATAQARGGQASREEGVMPRAVIRCISVVMLVVVAATGCASVESNPKAALGGLGGAAFGGLIAAAAGGGGAAIAGSGIGGPLLG